MIRYVFREDEPLRIKAAGKADAQVIGETLDEISKKNGGELHPKAVVEAARAKKHPLHQHFEWDDTLAAEAYRIDQARNLIRIVRVEDVNTEEGTARAFVSIAGKDGTSYRSMEDVKRSADLQLALLQSAERDLEAFQRRFRELTDVCKVVGQAREMVQSKRNKIESRAAA